MKSETFIRVAQLSELNGDGPFALSVNETDIVLVKSRGNWRAFEGRCPHQGALLGEGELDGARSSVAITVGVSRSVPGSAKVGRNVWHLVLSPSAMAASLSMSRGSRSVLRPTRRQGPLTTCPARTAGRWSATCINSTPPRFISFWRNGRVNTVRSTSSGWVLNGSSRRPTRH